jgi:hypothetical protein
VKRNRRASNVKKRFTESKLPPSDAIIIVTSVAIHVFVTTPVQIVESYTRGISSAKVCALVHRHRPEVARFPCVTTICVQTFARQIESTFIAWRICVGSGVLT